MKPECILLPARPGTHLAASYLFHQKKGLLLQSVMSCLSMEEVTSVQTEDMSQVGTEEMSYVTVEDAPLHEFPEIL